MRLVMVVPVFPQLSETFIVKKFLGLLEKGWDVHILCSRSEPGGWQNFPGLQKVGAAIRSRVHVGWPASPRWLAALLVLPALSRCLLARPMKTWMYLYRGFRCFGFDILRRLYLDAELILLRPDAVHFEFGALARERMYLRDRLGCKLLVSFRGYDLSHSGLDDSDFYQDVWQCTDGLHLLGEDLWQRAQQRGCPSGMYHALIPPAVDTAELKPERGATEQETTSKRPLRILGVGRTVWVKGYEYALQAVRILVDRGIPCEYRILGGGDMFEGIAFTRHQLGLEEVVELAGPQSPDEVRRQMEWADVFLQSSVQEGFCNAVLEAQAMQLPVVCSDAGGLPENVQDGVTGFIVPRRDPAAMAEKLAFLASRPDLRQSMGRAGRERVEALFNLPQQIDRFDAFYRQVLGNGTRKDD